MGDARIIEVLQSGGLVVMPTDTIFGILADASNVSAVGDVYALRNRPLDKPCIVLCGNVDQVRALVDISDDALRAVLGLDIYSDEHATTIIAPALNGTSHIHRGHHTIAIRVPKIHTPHGAMLRKIVEEVGPLIAPSANPAGENPADSIDAATAYFGEKVDLYIPPVHQLSVHPSRIYDATGINMKRVR